MFFFGPLIGKIYDSYGPRWLLLSGSVLEVFALMMTSLSSEYYQCVDPYQNGIEVLLTVYTALRFVLAQGVASSIGASMIFYPAMSTITTWFFKKRAFAFGIIAGGSSLGGVILPIMVSTGA